MVSPDFGYQLTLTQTRGQIMPTILLPGTRKSLNPPTALSYGVTLKVRDFERFSKIERAIGKQIWFMPKLKYILNPDI